jgi:hypothetical protein
MSPTSPVESARRERGRPAPARRAPAVALILTLTPLCLAGRPAAAQEAPADEGGPPPERRLELQASPAPAPATGSRDWGTFAMGAALVAGGAATGVLGATWLRRHGDGTCSPPAGLVCERLHDTKIPGWIAVGLALEAVAGGALLMWVSKDRWGTLALSPGGVSGRF